MRNPQRFAWDSQNGAMFSSDIGQNIVEEISRVTPGANLGWNVWEGSYKYGGREGVALENRRGDPKATDDLPLVDEHRLAPLVALLRLADGLDRGRAGAVEHVHVRLGPSLVVGDLDTRGDAELELWGARRNRARSDSYRRLR